MDILKLARSVDALFGIAFLIAAIWFFRDGSYWWAASFVLSSIVSFASVKYQPAKWVLKRVMLSKVKK